MLAAELLHLVGALDDVALHLRLVLADIDFGVTELVAQAKAYAPQGTCDVGKAAEVGAFRVVLEVYLAVGAETAHDAEAHIELLLEEGAGDVGGNHVEAGVVALEGVGLGVGNKE